MQGKLDQEKLRRFYDRFGKKQDKQGFYEDTPLDALIRQSDFRSAQAVFEIGCGTGKLAARLLSHHLQDTARYIGVDISSTMVELARNRLKPWAQRVQIHQSDGSFDFGSYGGPFDRIVATYVFDLLSRRQIDDAFNGAHAVAKKGALLCIAGLTKGIGPFSRATSKLWELIYNVNPYTVGGCRPLLLEGIFHAHARDWRITHRAVVVSATVPSEVITAEAV